MHTLGMVYAALSRYDEAIAMAERARDVALASKRADYAQLIPAIGLAIEQYRTAKDSGLGGAFQPPPDGDATADGE